MQATGRTPGGRRPGRSPDPWACRRRGGYGSGVSVGHEGTRVPVEVHEAWLPEDHPLRRPRHSARQRTALACAVVFFLTPLLAFTVGIRAGEIENRPLSRLPSGVGSWAWFGALQDWATDHLPLRAAAVRAQDVISHGMFGETPAARNGRQPSVPLAPQVGTTEGGRPRVDTSTFPQIIEGSDGWLYLGQDVTLKCAPQRSLDDTIGALRRLRRSVESTGRRFVLVVAPDKTTMAPEHLPASYPGRDCAQRATEEFWQRVPKETGAIDLRQPLRDVVQRLGPVYDGMDSHWTYEGGVVMTYAIGNELMPWLTPGWLVTPGKVTPWPADLPQLLGRNATRSLQSYGLAPDGHTDRTDYAPSDFRTATRYTSAPLDGTIGTSVGMIADSFTQFASPFLAAVCTDLTIVHPETVAGDPHAAAELLADKQTVVVELAERQLAGGASPLLLEPVLDEISRVLASRPPPG
jgi:alginate O-acetyltransferase complex protein AlgJ